MARKRQKTMFIAMTFHGWSRTPTMEEAISLLRNTYGAADLKSFGFTVYEVDPRTTIDPLGFGIIYPKGAPPKHVKTVEGTKRQTKQMVKKPAKKAPTHQEQIMDVNSNAAH
jgi:hypothetical protein